MVRTCQHCGLTEKYRHPNCLCRQNQFNLLSNKLVGAVVLELFINQVYDVINYCTKYNLNNNILYTIHSFVTHSVDFDVNPYPEEVTKDVYINHKLQSFGFEKQDVYKLFWFYQIFNNDDVFNYYIINLYLQIELDDD
jgi:hypothetical protein